VPDGWLDDRELTGAALDVVRDAELHDNSSSSTSGG
jgi:hypothetical protein